jgi:hypothetical protein
VKLQNLNFPQRSCLILKSSSKRILVVGKKVNDASIDAFNFRVKEFKKSPSKSHLALKMKDYDHLKGRNILPSEAVTHPRRLGSSCVRFANDSMS